MLTRYVIFSITLPGQRHVNWQTAYNAAKREEDEAFGALLDIAFPLTRGK